MLFRSHSAMKQIDESFKEIIQDIADDALDHHNSREEHPTREDIEEVVADVVEEQVRREVRDIDLSDMLHDAITDYDFDDKIDSYDFDDKIETYLVENDYPDADRVCEIVDEIVEEKVMGVLKKLLEKLNGV